MSTRPRLVGPGVTAKPQRLDRKWKVLLLVSVGSFMAFLDSTVVTIAFPAIEADFASASRETISWVLDAYFITFAALLVLAGRLADQFGRRRLFLAGLLVFSLASLICAVAPSAGVLIAGRIVQAAGAAMVVPAAQGILLSELPPEEWQRGLGVLAGIIGLAAAIGPVVGGLLVEGLDWRWVFWINLPVCIAALVFGARLLRESRPDAGAARPDAVGALLQAASISLVVLALLNGNDWGWDDARTIACLAGGAAGLAAFLARSMRHRAPVLDLRLFAIRRFGIGNAASFVYAVGFYAVIVNSVLFLSDVWHYSALEVGLAIAPGPFIAMFSAVAAGRACERFGYLPVAVTGATIACIGSVLLATLPGTQPDLSAWLPALLVFGLGNGIALTAMITASITAVPSSRFAVGSAVNAALRQVGGAVGIAALVAVVGTPQPFDALDAFQSGFWLTAIVIALSAMLAAGLGRAEPVSEQARETAVVPPGSARFDARETHGGG